MLCFSLPSRKGLISIHVATDCKNPQLVRVSYLLVFTPLARTFSAFLRHSSHCQLMIIFVRIDLGIY